MMFRNAMLAEKIKFRRSPILLAFVVMTLLSAVLGTANYQFNREILQNGWYSLWTQHTLFACTVFLPGELAVLCAWQWCLEHTDHCWNRLMTAPLPFAALYLAKLLWSILAAAAALGFIALCFVAGGVFSGFSLNQLPPEFLGWLVFGWFGCLAVCAWQQLFSMLVRSFAVPVAASLLFGFGGLLLMARGWGLVWPWSLLDLGMRANDPTRVLPVFSFLLACGLLTLLPTLIALILVPRLDIRAE